MKNPIFKRKLYDKMLKWKEESNGSSALLIRGARRIGKSTIAEEFAKNEYKSYILINFVSAPKEVHDLFLDISDLDFLFLRLQVIYKKDLFERNSVIIFDEIQENKYARQAIKFLVADKRYDYIETGSLISIRKNIQGIVIPSEETRIQMHPMDYEEFCWALNDYTTIPLLRNVFESRKSLGNDMNRTLMRRFRLYMLVGGMPQAVEAYINTNNLSTVDAKKREILDLYEDDFMKVDPSGKASALFKDIPAQLSSNATRYKISSVLEGKREIRTRELVNNMADSMVVNIAYHANDPNIGFTLNRDISRYKMYMADTGLFVTLAFRDKDFTENIIYEKLLSDKLNTNLGYIYENMVAQMLKANGNELFYYTFPKENSSHHYEIDFLISKKNKICPIEVKSSGYRTHKSLDLFFAEFSGRILSRYLVYPKDMRKDQDVLCMPIYMTEFL